MGVGRGRGGCDSSSALLIGGGGGCCVVIIVAAVLIGVSVKTLDSNEIGLDYDGFNMQVNSKLYTGGTYFLGLAHSFLDFPATQQTIMFADHSSNGKPDGPSIASRSKDGLPVSISYSFNYRFKQQADDLMNIYLNYGTYDDADFLYQRIACNIVRSVCSQYLSSDFFTSTRGTIQSAMQAQLNAELALVGGNVENFQLLDVGIPTAFTDARNRQQSAIQEVTKAQNELTVASINSQTNVLVAQQAANLIISQAQVNAQKAQLTTQASIASLQARYLAERQSYGNIAQKLGLSPQELLTFIWLDAQAEGNGKADTSGKVKPLINFPAPQAEPLTP